MYQKLTIDLDALVAAIEIARQVTPEGHSWRQPLEDAYDQLMQSEYIYLADHGTVLFQSSRYPAQLYTTSLKDSATCTCPAFRHHKPCWHRAAARLLQRMTEYRQAQVQPEPVYTAPVSYEQAVREMDELFPAR